MAKYLVFLDIDGVFTSNRVHFAHNSDNPMWTRFDPVAIDFMNRIHDTYSVEFVLCSTWKKHLKNDDAMVRHWVQAAFASAGLRGVFADLWKTDPDNIIWTRAGKNDRAHEVQDYIATYKPDDFIIFDDSRYRYNEVLGIKRLIYTDCDNGITFKNMLDAWALMGTWEKKK